MPSVDTITPITPISRLVALGPGPDKRKWNPVDPSKSDLYEVGMWSYILQPLVGGGLKVVTSHGRFSLGLGDQVDLVQDSTRGYSHKGLHKIVGIEGENGLVVVGEVPDRALPHWIAK